MHTKRSFFRRSLVWVGLTCMLAGGTATAASSDTGVYAIGDLNGLASGLEQRGWHTATDRDGSLLITHFAPAASRVASQTREPAQEVGSHQGGSVAQAPSGGPQLDEMAVRLAATGWDLSRDADGSLLFHRAAGHSPSGASEQRETVAQHQQTRQQASPDWLASLGEGLKRHGWGVEREQSGALTLFPPHSVAGEGESQEIAVTSAPLTDVDLAAVLSQRGWDFRRDSVGNVLLIPTA